METHSQKSELAASPQNSCTSVARSVAPEDIQCGDFLAALARCYEVPSFLWCCDSSLQNLDKPVRLWYESNNQIECVYRVKSICLPWILVRDPSGNYKQLDVRSYRFAKLSKEYGKTATKKAKKKNK